ncbi:MAG: leucine-rich repeat domain-containing protein, partial [Treponema sp.]|nr:leucine-rich repeat domain-containing protein [Treponema sp.]
VKIVDPDWKNQSGATLEVIAQDLENVKSPLTLDLSEIAVENLSELFTKDNVDRVAFGDENARYDAEGNVVVSGKDAKPINIERVVIPATLENFSSNLFANCMAVKEFVVPEENEWFCTNNSTNGGRGEKGAGHILYQKMKINSGGVTSPDSNRLVVVAIATSFTGDLELDANTVQIAHQAAYGCQGVKSVNWSSLQKLERIGMYSFMKCTGLKSVTVPKNVTSIDGYTFTGCYNIESLDFEPESKLYYIGSRAFQTEAKVNDVTKNELSGKTINLPASLTKLGGQVFGNMYNKMTINFSNEGTGTWYYFVTSEKSFLESGFNANGWNNTSADKTGGIIEKLIAGVSYTDSNGNPHVFKATEVGSGSDMTTGYKSKDTLTLWNGNGYDEPKECSLGGHVDCYWFRK